MRRSLIIGVVLAALAVPTGGLAATHTISVTSTGFSPRNVTIAAGDTVTWTNTDRVSHRVVVDRTTCNLTIAAGASGSCTFGNTGRYDYRDPNMRGNNWRGVITVQAAPGGTVTITARPGIIRYGGASTLSGALSNQRVGESVRIEAQVCGGSSFATVATVTTTTGGAWTLAVRPLKNTVYRARWRNATSANATVRVRPRITLRKLTRGRFAVRVRAAESFAGKVAVFQRYRAATRRWSRVKYVTLRAMGGTAPTMISGANFRSAVRVGTRVRVAMTQTQVGGCYAPGVSNIVRR
jgi:plastocyanin